MKKATLTIIATIIVTFAISMFAFQPTATEAMNNATPSATPRKRLPKPIQSPVTIQSPKPIQSPVTRIRSKQSRKKRGIPAPTPSPITKQIGIPAPTPSPEN